MNDNLSRARSWGLAAIQIGAGLLFLFAGGSKLLGASEMVATFEKVGFGQWFRYLTGSLEVMGAIGLQFPRTSVYAAALLTCVMIGAVLTHLVLIGGSPAMAAILLLLMLTVVWMRRSEFMQRT
ncbi:MAG: DoxX family protein [Bryobacteraceae bacterium]